MKRIEARDIEAFRLTARQMRRDIIKMLTRAGSGHPGGSLSAIDILTVLYYYKMRHKPEYPDWPQRDRFVLSKGHAAPALYAVLGNCGYFDKKEFDTLRKLEGRLQGHPDRLTTPGVDVSTGSLGQGLSIACGMALAGKLDGSPFRVYAVIGDGESQEGEIWEAAMAAAHYKMDNLCAIIDCNGLQIDGAVKNILGIEPVINKWQAFGWSCKEIDGHDYAQVIEALDSAEQVKDKPSMIIARTIKGKGVSFMENVVKFHGVTPTEEELRQAIRELEE
jgi:transketolase